MPQSKELVFFPSSEYIQMTLPEICLIYLDNPIIHSDIRIAQRDVQSTLPDVPSTYLDIGFV